jgi:hypothetical protein
MAKSRSLVARAASRRDRDRLLLEGEGGVIGERAIRQAFLEWRPERASAVGFLAMEDRMDAQGAARFFGEADAVVADAKAQLAGLSLELLDVALVGLGETM